MRVFRNLVFSSILLFLAAFPVLFVSAQVTDSLSGRLEIAHPGFEGHRYVKSFLYVFELNRYFEIAPDGTFLVDGLIDGRYSFKTYVPGFKPSYRTVVFPDQDNLVIRVGLQTVPLDTIRIERKVAGFLKGVRDLLLSPAVAPSAPAPVSPLPSGEQSTEPTVNLLKVFDSIRNLFRRKRDEE